MWGNEMSEENSGDIYDSKSREELSDNDEIEPFEEAFMIGYGEAI